MKTLSILLLFSLGAIAQTNIITSGEWPITIAGITVTVNPTQDAAVAGTNAIFQTAGSGTGATTLTAAVTSTSQTTFALANITGIVLGNGICFSSSSSVCAMSMTTNGTANNLTLSTGELTRVTAVTPGSGTTGTVTVVRASIGTAATYSSGQAVTITQFGSYSDLALSFIQAGYSTLIKNCTYLAYSCTTEVGAINTAQSTLNANSILPKTN